MIGHAIRSRSPMAPETRYARSGEFHIAYQTYGDGPIVEGDAKHLLSAMTGRTAALDSLTGDGVDVLRSRD